jgi:hypothetical protein
MARTRGTRSLRRSATMPLTKTIRASGREKMATCQTPCGARSGLAMEAASAPPCENSTNAANPISIQRNGRAEARSTDCLIDSSLRSTEDVVSDDVRLQAILRLVPQDRKWPASDGPLVGPTPFRVAAFAHSEWRVTSIPSGAIPALNAVAHSGQTSRTQCLQTHRSKCSRGAGSAFNPGGRPRLKAKLSHWLTSAPSYERKSARPPENRLRACNQCKYKVANAPLAFKRPIALPL